MAPIATALRRALLLLILAAGVGVAVSSWRGRSATPTPAAPPQWPPWPQQQPQAPEPPVPFDAPAPEPPDSFDAPASDAYASEPAWLPAPGDGTAPESHPIKVKVSSGIYHVPGGRFYERTRADRCYSTADAAEADGYRRSKT